MRSKRFIALCTFLSIVLTSTFAIASTPVFTCGFEEGVAGPHWTLNGAPTFDTGTVISGARSLLAAAGARSASSVATFGSGIVVARFRVSFATLPSVTTRLWIISGRNEGVYFQASDSKIYAGSQNGPLLFGATGITVTTGVTYYIAVRTDVSTTTKTVDVSVNGVAAGQRSDANTADTTARSVVVGWLDAGTGSATFDDVTVSATSGDHPLGDGYINHFVPTADGTHNVAGTADFQRTLTGTDILNATTTAFQLLDDVPMETGTSVDWINLLAPPNATDYTECIFGPASGISTPTSAPRAVEVVAGIHQAATGTGNMEIRLNDNGTTNVVYTATTVAGVTSIIYKRKHYATAPTGGAWTLVAGSGNFNDIRVRFGSPAAVDANPDQYLDGIMIEADFDPSAVVVPGCKNGLLLRGAGCDNVVIH